MSYEQVYPQKPAGRGLLQDLGFLSFTLPQVEILMPTKKPRGAELTLEPHLVGPPAHQTLDLVRTRVRRDVEVDGRALEQRVAHAPADEIALMPGLGQTRSHPLQRRVGGEEHLQTLGNGGHDPIVANLTPAGRGGGALSL